MGERTDEGTESREPFTPVPRCELHGQVAVILCWWIDGTDESDCPFDELEEMREYIELIPYLLTGETEHFTKGVWRMFYDALGSYPQRDETLEALYDVCHDACFGQDKHPRTKAFCDERGYRLPNPELN